MLCFYQLKFTFITCTYSNASPQIITFFMGRMAACNNDSEILLNEISCTGMLLCYCTLYATITPIYKHSAYECRLYSIYLFIERDHKLRFKCLNDVAPTPFISVIIYRAPTAEW